ncbi:hypothetical protein B9Q11_03780 [Candidatus Marsarchaeota G2 archaeon ECH_B_SAG-F08]|uniref:ABC transporter domain-containing protein n=3 Tax=Candidatus Marsarchaeota group 2 TaxID=2203771 RepID=A0A2R6BGI4_9ARCH|nr:MAG: hypothetical protein B9Q11_03780 [Candidatus Marsarchaeota G2 archaeon ECH_B_SAG-F08]PSO03617.1 MAG: hypothetical protein B9Q10_00435 [Candidatus Marsarchaeota G2 archaeon ECH_B_SAG-E12]PSO03987.1 MAG: hypothetical protein B9Q13_05845 [Candidatus Marsarchaeota G2 archaeon ECH_B_SAG-G16]
MSAVVLQNVSKRFGSFLALNEVSFSIEKGESFALIGPNGAGKTTTLRIVCGLVKPSSGLVKVFGEDPSNSRIRSQISILPEDAGVYEKLTAWESIYYYALLRGLDKSSAEQKAEELIRVLDLQQKRNEYGVKLSKGLKRKVLIGMCLVNDPKLLVLDEPTDGLDVRSARNVRELLKALVSEGKTLIVSSHNMLEIQDVAQKIAIINKGKLVAEGEPDRLLANYGARSLEELFLGLTEEGVT